MFIEERKRKTKKAGKRLCTASPEPVRSAANAPSAPKPSETRIEGKEHEHAEEAGLESHADYEADAQIDDRLHDAQRHDPAELSGEQGDAAHRRQRETVEEPGLDVAGKIGAGVHRREESALDERHRQPEGDEGIGRK